MFDAGMKIKVVTSSIEKMEKIIFSPEQQDPMNALSYY
jgi:hypothetical protein